jgi:hypothetical protein
VQASQRKTGLGIDVGGTYTDAVIYALPANMLLSKNKSLTTKWDFTEGIRDSLSTFEPGLLASVDLQARSLSAGTSRFAPAREAAFESKESRGCITFGFSVRQSTSPRPNCGESFWNLPQTPARWKPR